MTFAFEVWEPRTISDSAGRVIFTSHVTKDILKILTPEIALLT